MCLWFVFHSNAIQIDIFIIYLVINLWLPPEVVERKAAECCLDILDIKYLFTMRIGGSSI